MPLRLLGTIWIRPPPKVLSSIGWPYARASSRNWRDRPILAPHSGRDTLFLLEPIGNARREWPLSCSRNRFLTRYPATFICVATEPVYLFGWAMHKWALIASHTVLRYQRRGLRTVPQTRILSPHDRRHEAERGIARTARARGYARNSFAFASPSRRRFSLSKCATSAHPNPPRSATRSRDCEEKR
jgi:hypothetical protein